MSGPTVPVRPNNIQSLEAHQVVSTGVVTVLTYTVPTGRVAKLVMATIGGITGTPPTVALQLQRGGNTTTLESGNVQVDPPTGGWFLAGDTVRWQVTAGGAASSVDAYLSFEEYEAQ